MQKGTKLGKMEIISISSGGGVGKHKIYKCKCECGKIKSIKSHNFKKGKHCSCTKHLYRDLTGEVIGKVKVLHLLKRNNNFNNKRGHLYQCQCLDCGSIKEYQSSTINRRGFKGCRCPKDLELSSKKSWYKTYKNNALKRGLPFEISFTRFVELCESSCYYTGEKGSITIDKPDLFGKWDCNGIDRLDNSIGYVEGNVVPCSKEVNRMKGKLTLKEFKRIIDLIKINYET